MSEQLEQPDLVDVEGPSQQTNLLRLLVHFDTVEARRAFSLLLGQRVDAETKQISYPVANRVPKDAMFGAEDVQAEQHDLFTVNENWIDTWRGMPSYSHRDMAPYQTIHVYFTTPQDRLDFCRLINHPVTDETKYVYFPRAEVDKVVNLRWRSRTPLNPRYPVYVPTKGRWDSALTIKCMERLRIPYYAVVQPQEAQHYAPVVKTGTMLLLPEGLDGLVPTRNWIYEHSIAAGAERHWQLDDNITSFFRYHENRQIHCSDGTCMRVAEDFADRYENIAIAGFQYFMFVKRKFGGWPPYVFNTRVYSNSLINNHMPFRYRDVYNDDTDICLRALKAGWCTVQFNAFLAWKQPTMRVKGGNTPIYLGAEQVAADWQTHAKTCKLCEVDVSPRTCEEGRAILQKDGRWRMADSLLRQHPDVTIVMRRWNRWQHYVDYRQFKSNEPRFREGFTLPAGQEDYGLELVTIAPGEDPIQQATAAPVESRAKTSAPTPLPPRATVSALSFIARLAAAEPAPAGSSVAPPGAGKAPDPVPEPAQGTNPPVPAALQPEPAQDAGLDPAQALKQSLEARGHLLLTRDGKFFVANASQLTEADRAAIKEHREALITLATPWVDPQVRVDPSEPQAPHPAPPEPALGPSLPDEIPPGASEGSLFVEEPQRTQSLAEFLGMQTSTSTWTPQEPPDLTGIDTIILNFATTGFNWVGGDRPVGVTVSSLDGQMTRFLPFGFRGSGNLDETAVKRWMQEQVRGKHIVNSKTKFDVHHAREWGVDLEAQGNTFGDIQHDAALLDDHRKRFGLDFLVKDYLEGAEVPRVDESMHAEYSPADVADREIYTAQCVARLRAVFDPLIAEQELTAVRKLEDEVIPTVVEMERNGSPLDMELCEQMHRECMQEHGRLMLEASQEAGFAVEHNASGYKRLFEHFGLAPSDSYDEAVMTQVEHPTIRKVYHASQYASLDSKTFSAYMKNVDSRGILRYDINQLRGDGGGTVSGRFSIGLVQQVPNHDNHHTVFGNIEEIDSCLGLCPLFPRRLFIPGSGDYLEADAAQIEFRLLVHYTGNKALLEAYAANPQMSYHKIMQARLKTYKPDMLYTHTKSYNFAAQYGARSIKLAVMMCFITEEEGAEIRRAKRWNDPRLSLIHEIEAAVKKAHPEAGELLDRAAHLAKPKCDDYCKQGDALHREHPHRGYVMTIEKRRSRFPNAYKTYIALNRVLQGSGADIMKRKLVELHRERKTTGFLMRLTNHDAVLGDAQTQETKARVAELLNAQSYPQLKVPILWDVKQGSNWAQAKG